jgi:thiol-disulfide isomerase/thioredoxin
VDDFPTAIGAPMADFTLTDETGTPVSLSDYAGMIVLINGFAEWCTYCKQEADEMAELIAEYNGAGDPVAMLGLMHETNSGSSDIPQATLQDWSDDHGWGGLIPCLDDGDPPTVQEDYWWTPAFPFNMILDADHVIRVKWHGYGSGLIEDVIDWLLEG